MSPLDLIPAPYRLAAQFGAWFLVAAALMAGYWWVVRYHEDVGYRRAVAEYQMKLIEATDAARHREREMQAKVDEAEKGAEREKRHQVELAVLDSANRRLLNDITDFRHRLPGLAGPACIAAADTAAELFGECADEYRALAGKADRHAIDADTLTDAWP